MEFFEAAMAEAEQGREIVESCALGGSGLVLIFPDDDPETLDVVLTQLDRCVADYGSGTVITSIDLPDLCQYTSYPLTVTRISEKDMCGVLRYASAANTDVLSIKILSLRVPYSQQAEILKGFKDLNTYRIVRHGLFGIWEGS